MKVLVIEDEKKLAEYLRLALTEHNYVVDVAMDRISGLHLARESQYDLILLDVMLPGMDGFSVLRELRKSDRVPVLMLMARDKIEDRVKGLRDGADDYLVKPFALSELLARVLALGRRSGQNQAEVGGQNVLRVGDLELDLLRRRASRGGVRLDLTAKEFTLLALLMRKQGEVLSRLELAEQVWDINFNSNTNVVEVAVRRLRGKVDDPLTRSCCTRCAAWATCWNCGKTDAAALRLPAPLALALAGDADVPGAGRGMPGGVLRHQPEPADPPGSAAATEDGSHPPPGRRERRHRRFDHPAAQAKRFLLWPPGFFPGAGDRWRQDRVRRRHRRG